LKISCLIFLILVFAGFDVYSQPYTLEIQIKNQPHNNIVLGKITGDDFQPLDTILFHRGNSKVAENSKKAEYTFPEKMEPGMYRLVFGKTTYAKVMGDSPQQLDFIFNYENLIFETDFKAPAENLLVVLSEENRVWFEFLKRHKEYQEKINLLELEIDYYRNKGNEVTKSGTPVAELITRFNTLRQQREDFINEIVVRNPKLFASRLINMYREPIPDGHLSKKVRREIFQKEFFSLHDFTDETLINSTIYTDRIFYYLASYNRSAYTKEQLEKEYIKAVDMVLANTNENLNVYEFILEYLVNGFEVLKMNSVLNYIADNYAGTTCQTDEKTTLERKLEAQKMRPGTVIPDFSLTNFEGLETKLSEVQKEKTLILFWASWCPHCIDMLPLIKSWADGQNNLEIVTVSLDTSFLEWQDAVKKLKIENWINLSDLKKWDGKVTTALNIYATPTMFLIDKERKILAKPITVQDLMHLN